ncbi:MAG: RagB/SusD family nutrient uptake outer membrane protein [Bacteroidota bacterium]
MKISIFNKPVVAIAILIVTIIGIGSCKKFLEVEPVSSFGSDYVFGTVSNAKTALLGAYASLTGDQTYGIRISMYYPFDNDLMMGQGGTPYPDNERRDIAHFNLNANNTQLAAPFNQLYAGIEKSNICIYNIPKMDGYNNSAELKRMHGEALTLRAQFYLELIRNWGDVPAQFLPSSVEEDLFKSKMDRDTIYNHLLDDLALAETLVPWRTEVSVDERITQGAVRALRARIALYRGGYSLRRNRQMERGSNFKAYYQIAKDECTAIMQSGQHNLNSSYESVFKNYIAGKQIEPNGEVIWEVAMSGGNSALGDSKLGYYCGPRANNNGNSALNILPSYFYMFDSTDTRRDVVCAPYYVEANGTTITARTGRGIDAMPDGNYRRDWIPGGLTIGPQYFGVNWPILRYSDVLLMFAEADNEINNGPTAAAKAAFEKVRLRAFGGNAGLIGTTPSDYAGFFNAIVNERALELGNEGIRKYDLIRWNLMATKIAATKATLLAMSTRQPPYDNLPDYMFYQNNSPTLKWAGSYYKPNTFGNTAPAGYTLVNWVRDNINSSILTYYAIAFTPNKSELLPIPQASLDANPLLKQDYGY